MSIYYYSMAFGLTSIFSVIIGLVRFKKILKPYRFFVVFVAVGLLNDLLNLIVVELWHQNIVNANVYVLLEALILLILFYKWGSFGKKMLIFLAATFCLVWIGENLVFGSIKRINSLFRLFYSLAIVILAIDQINITMMHERKNILRNAKFIICCLFAFYFAFRATFEVFYVVPLRMSNDFYSNLFLILVFVNLFANLGYALAALWIPTKQKFTLPY
jgi:hypothetical protein